jgi:hypothetical protein
LSGEDVEKATGQDFCPRRHRGPKIGITHRDDGKVGSQDKVEARRSLEQRPEVGLRERTNLGSLAGRSITHGGIALLNDPSERSWLYHDWRLALVTNPRITMLQSYDTA